MSLPRRSIQGAGATAGNDLGVRQQARLQQVGGEVEAAAEVLARERCFQHPQRDIEGGQAVVGELCPRLMPALVHGGHRSEEHTSELQSLMRISYAVFCLKKKKKQMKKA